MAERSLLCPVTCPRIYIYILFPPSPRDRCRSAIIIIIIIYKVEEIMSKTFRKVLVRDTRQKHAP